MHFGGRRRRRDPDGSGGARALQLVQLGELQAIEGAELALGSELILSVAQPGAQTGRSPRSNSRRHHEHAHEFELDEMLFS